MEFFGKNPERIAGEVLQEIVSNEDSWYQQIESDPDLFFSSQPASAAETAFRVAYQIREVLQNPQKKFGLVLAQNNMGIPVVSNSRFLIEERILPAKSLGLVLSEMLNLEIDRGDMTKLDSRITAVLEASSVRAAEQHGDNSQKQFDDHHEANGRKSSRIGIFFEPSASDWSRRKGIRTSYGVFLHLELDPQDPVLVEGGELYLRNELRTKRLEAANKLITSDILQSGYRRVYGTNVPRNFPLSKKSIQSATSETFPLDKSRARVSVRMSAHIAAFLGLEHNQANNKAMIEGYFQSADEVMKVIEQRDDYETYVPERDNNGFSHLDRDEYACLYICLDGSHCIGVRKDIPEGENFEVEFTMSDRIRIPMIEAAILSTRETLRFLEKEESRLKTAAPQNP